MKRFLTLAIAGFIAFVGIVAQAAVTDYKVVKGQSIDDLSTQISAAISDGWQPYFGAIGKNDGSYAQPMIKGSQVLVGATGAAGADGTVKTFYGETSSAANTYAVTITGATLATGNIFAIKFDHAPTGAATLNVNSLGAKAIKLPNGAAIADTQGVDGQTNWMVYDGTQFILVITPNNAYVPATMDQFALAA